MRANRTIAIAIVALSQASLGYALVTSLAYTVVREAPDGLKIFNVEEKQPPPPPERHSTLKRAPERQPRVEAPRPPVVRTDVTPPADAPTVSHTLPAEITPAASPAPPPTQAAPPPPAIETMPPRSASGDLQSLFRPTDYPVTALERREQGSVIVRLTVGVAGRVGACDVTSSSGSRALDYASCRILQTRALFTPARDRRGNLATDTVVQEIRWMLG